MATMDLLFLDLQLQKNHSQRTAHDVRGFELLDAGEASVTIAALEPAEILTEQHTMRRSNLLCQAINSSRNQVS